MYPPPPSLPPAPVATGQKKRTGIKKDDDDIEPVFWFQPARSLVEELLHLARAKAVIDLTAGAGTWALAALEFNIPYFGLVLTDIHHQEFMARLIKQA